MIEALLAGLFGLLIGSFLNVCIYRLPRDLSVVRPRSHCPECEKTIAWYDNIPVLSYFALGGRCRYCRTSIPSRYWIVEGLTGALFFLCVLLFGPTLAALKYSLFCALQVGLVFTDLEERILPDEFTLGGTAAGILLAWWVPVDDVTARALLWIYSVEPGPRGASVAEAALGAVLPAFFLWAGGWIYEKVRHREGLGFGDVKLMMLIGAFLGMRGALLTLLAGSVLGSVIGYAFIRLSGKDAASYELPFGTFLGFAAIAVALAGGPVMAWYGGLY